MFYYHQLRQLVIQYHQFIIIDLCYYFIINFCKKINFIALFYGWGSTAPRLEPLLGGSLLFTTLNRMKFWIRFWDQILNLTYTS